MTAQRRPESELRRHASASQLARFKQQAAQRRPESELRRHMWSMRRRRVFQRSLNEGRSLNSGDTMVEVMSSPEGNSAQRRPESELRRHMWSMRRRRVFQRSLNEGRSLNSGDTMVEVMSSPRATPLNEGRSLNSGDTRASCAMSVWPLLPAQRRPESELRRHRRCGKWRVARPCAAQRRPESELRRHPHSRCSARTATGPLNEGRSLNSGDTSATLSPPTCTQAAQRRPESELRRHTARRVRLA